MTMIRFFFTGLAVALALSACGGGGGGGGSGAPVSSVATGQFLDSKVQGLRYSSGNQTGITDAEGRFTYQPGTNITFSVGNFTIGTVASNSIVTASVLTPVNLAAGADVTHPSVITIARFLMMLDQDGNPDNGITISPAVQAAAANWPIINFLSTTYFTTGAFDSDANVQAIVASVSAADSRAAVLPTATAAQSHLTTTMYCGMGGGYLGNWSGRYTQTGNVSGSWNGVIDPITGNMMGHITGSGADITVGTTVMTRAIANLTVHTTGLVDFIMNGTVTMSGSVMGGSWLDNTNPSNTGNGPFTGSRISFALPAGASGNVYQGTMIGSAVGYSPPSYEFSAYSFAISNNGSVSGAGKNLTTNTDFTVSGSVTGSTITGTSSLGDTFTGTVNANGTVTGTYSHAPFSGSFNACRPM